MANSFVSRNLTEVRTISKRSEDVSIIAKPSPKPISTLKKGTILSEKAAQKNNLIEMIFDVSSSVEVHHQRTVEALNDLLNWAMTADEALGTDLAISTVAASVERFGPEPFSAFKSFPEFDYKVGSYVGLAVRSFLETFQELRSQYKRIGLVIVHDWYLHDPEVLDQQLARLHELETKNPRTFAVYPLGIGDCDESILSKISCKRAGKILSQSHDFMEVVQWLKQFTQNLSSGILPQD